MEKILEDVDKQILTKFFSLCFTGEKTSPPVFPKSNSFPSEISSSGSLNNEKKTNVREVERRGDKSEKVAVLSTPVFHVEHAFVSISLLESEDLQMNSDMTVDSELNSVSPLSFMELALQQAKFALKNLEVPVGCVIVENCKVIASGSNRTNEFRNATRHAEMDAIDILLKEWQEIGLNQLQIAEKFTKCVLYVTCEPCIMCATALSILGIGEVYFGCPNDKFGGCGSVLSLQNRHSYKGSQIPEGKNFRCSGGIMSSEAVALLRSFYEQGNPNAPKPHRSVRISQ